jgi:hypothetical protein
MYNVHYRRSLFAVPQLDQKSEEERRPVGMRDPSSYWMRKWSREVWRKNVEGCGGPDMDGRRRCHVDTLAIRPGASYIRTLIIAADQKSSLRVASA